MDSTQSNNILETDFSDSWGWIVLGGVVSVILGVIAYLYPVMSTVSITIFVASLLLIGGAIQFAQSVALWKKPHNALRMLRSIVMVVAGVLMFRYPSGGMEAVALTMSFYFFVAAALQWMLASAIPVGRGWGYFSSILTFFLGVFIIASFPFSALWVPGLLLGIDFVFTGITTIAFGIAIHKPTPTLHHAH
jgi:uncharacterized membrane protein HdeD (DUF308 family)